MTTEKSLVAEAENPQHRPQKEEGEGATSSGQQETQLEEASQAAAEGDNQCEQKLKTSNGDTPTHEDLSRNKERASENRGLSRLFSSFLKRPKSQVSEEEGKEVESAKEKGEGGQKEIEFGASLDEEIILKAPIAAPEPELKTDPSLDLHSLSSAETQPAQEEHREDPDFETKEEGGLEECSKIEVKEESPESKAERELKASQKSIRRHGSMHCKVSLLDDTVYECVVEKHAKGQDLLKRVCEHLNLLEEDYFGLAIWDNATSKTWLDSAKEIKKQVRGVPWNFTFNVKFYPPDPAQLTEDITRYYLCLQLRQDIVSGRLPCSFATLALLGSYTIQSELGDYDPELHGADYVSDFKLAPNQTKELEEKVMELHKSYRSMTPAQADLEFLENAKKLSMYGVDLHKAKDLEGVDIILGVCSSGLLVYKEKLRINRFPWPKVLKISYKRSSFFIKIRPGEQEQYESTIGFKLPSYRAAKKLWKVCVEHHTFFRLTSTDTIPKSKFLALGSKFRYSGRTQAQTRQASALIDRPAPHFERTASKRASRSLDGAAAVESADRSPRPTSAPAIAPSQAAEGGAPGAPVQKAQTEAVQLEVKPEEAPPEEAEPEPTEAWKVEKTHIEVTVPTPNGDQTQKLAEKPEDLIRMRKKKRERLDGENIYIRHSNLMLEDLDKSQEEIKKHHASISELKKNFMESVPEPRPSEWDKRLSTHSPFRTLNINGQIPTGEGVKKTSVLPSERKVGGPENINGIRTEEVAAVAPGPSTNPDSEGEGPKRSVIPSKSQMTASPESPKHFDFGSLSVSSKETEEKELEAAGSLDIKEELSGPGGECIGVEEQASALQASVSPASSQLQLGDKKAESSEQRVAPGEPLGKQNGSLLDSRVGNQFPTVIRSFQPPLVKTQTVTISDTANAVKSEIPTKDVPIVHTETKTITYEAAQTDDSNGDLDPGVLLTAQTITSETTSSTTTTQITKTVKGGISETRIEKRIVITGDADIDHDQVLVQAIKEAKEQHPDMSVTKVVVHQETEISEE
ncbi:protein 4.1 isoform X2 [Ovis aries]|uniref:protein 4.1 isoform X2 n=2 Tax=Ovis aries TaxID=9940 RepID=UPI001C2E04B0|nr:protein 4.1 isoform X2 [Ovis aries]XP_042100393.1 protein 4.1 isoform X1 [Ovis aries]XP_042100394.1 protein 4.1 isoform X2 [Ovis aries]XP_042100395.1 protein 4.1 isoform X1 [Ovis aries]